MNLDVLYQWMNVIQLHFPNLMHWQAVGLALFSYGVVKARACQVSVVAEELGAVGDVSSIEKRLKRWLGNPRIKVTLCCQHWIAWVWSCCELPRAILLVDETKLGARIGVMMVSLAYHERAIPLMWCCYRANSAPDYPQQGQVLLVWGLLAKVINALPSDSRPLVQMDRGLAHSSAMIRALRSLQLDYVVRIKQTARFTSRRGHSSLLADLIKPGEYLTCHGTLFTRHRQVTAHLVLVWEQGQEQPWCLLVSSTQLQGRGYAVRMWQEASFRDLKSGGWQWQTSQLLLPERAERLILVLAVAYGWMLTQGTFVLNATSDSCFAVAPNLLQKYSIFRLGLRFFKQMIAQAGHRIYVGLFFAPPLKPVYRKLSP